MLQRLDAGLIKKVRDFITFLRSLPGFIISHLLRNVNLKFLRYMSLTSIVLAVYVAAMMGLIGAKLGEKLAKMPSRDPEYTQLWVLRRYFSNAVIASVLTIIASSLILLLPERRACDPMSNLYRQASSLSLAVYAVNLVYMGFIMKFMLDRQIWDA